MLSIKLIGKLIIFKNKTLKKYIICLPRINFYSILRVLLYDLVKLYSLQILTLL